MPHRHSQDLPAAYPPESGSGTGRAMTRWRRRAEGSTSGCRLATGIRYQGGRTMMMTHGSRKFRYLLLAAALGLGALFLPASRVHAGGTSSGAQVPWWQINGAAPSWLNVKLLKAEVKPSAKPGYEVWTMSWAFTNQSKASQKV